MTDKLTELIADHMLAVRAFGHALDKALGETTEDEALEAEGLAMMALLCFVPETIEEARRRAVYLVASRFPLSLDAEGRAFLMSFVPTDGRDC